MQISAREANHRLNGDESPSGAIRHVRVPNFSTFEQRLKSGGIFTAYKIPIVYSSNEENDIIKLCNLS